MTGLFFTAQMGRLHDSGIPVFLIAGNHDAASQITRALRPPPSLRALSTRAPETCVLDDLGVAIHGQGFPTRAVTDDLTRAYPLADAALFNIGLLHTSLDGRPGHAPYAPCTLDGLRSRGYQYWALGHVHQHELIAVDPYVVYPGNLQGRHIRETGPKGAVLVEVRDGQVTAITPQALDVVRWALCSIDVSEARTQDQVLQLIEQSLWRALDAAEGRPLAARLRLIGASPLHARLQAAREKLLNESRALVLAAGRGEVWIEKLMVETSPLGTRTDLARADALGGLLRSIHAIELDAARLATLSAELEPLALKLPAELRMGDDPFDPLQPEQLQVSLEEVKALLVERLLGGDERVVEGP